MPTARARGEAAQSGARAGRARIAAAAEGERFEPLRALRDSLDIGHAERGLDQALETDFFLALLPLLDLRDQHVDGVDVLRHAGLGNEDHVEAWAVLHHVNHVAIA